jgi:hypothetical protein
MPTVPIRWPLYLILALVSSCGLWISWKVRNGYTPEQAISLQDIIFRWPLALTLAYSIAQLFRTVWIWVDINNVYATRVLYDPPGNDIMAAINNGVLLTWASIYVLFLYLRRHEV